MAATIEVRDLSHTYSAGTPFQHDAVKHMSFSVEKGEFLGIIGHTGSGKSTLIQHLNGLLRPTSGEILLDGTNIWQDKKTTRESRFRVGWCSSIRSISCLKKPFTAISRSVRRTWA